MLCIWVDSFLTMAGESASGEWTRPVRTDRRVMLLYLGPAPCPGRTTDVTTELPGAQMEN